MPTTEWPSMKKDAFLPAGADKAMITSQTIIYLT